VGKVITSRTRRILGFSRQLGFDPILFVTAIFGSTKFLRDIFHFYFKQRKSDLNIALRLSPILSDFRSSAGHADGHYFWQDLICAKWIYDRNPKDHFDVASRIDGFIAHLLTFRAVTILDIRPLEVSIPNLEVLLGNAQGDISSLNHQYTSVSSLHSIEHFGLGRYGDPIDPLGHLKGLQNIANCVAKGGALYVSFPIGKPAVEYNAQRIISPMWPEEALPEFLLEEFVLIPWRGTPQYGMRPADVDVNNWGQAGLYRFIRK
jgi:Caenorhabditis protein of unknown function, DUF268